MRPDSLPLSVNLMATAPVADIVELAVLAEESGCRRCWVYDEGLVTRDVYLTLAAIASRTERVGLGPGITNAYVRHPGATAAAIATLDEISGGRAFLGLGAGGGLTLGPLAIERVRPLASVRDTVEVVRRLFRGEVVDHDGPTFSLRGAQLSYGRPETEIMLAGRGPKMLELGAAVADGFYLSYIHKELLGDAVDTLRRGAAGRRFVVTYSTMIAVTDAEREAARAQLTFRLVDSPPDVKSMLGMTEADTDALRRALAAGGPSAAAVHVRPEWLPHFVITGTFDECAAELHALIARHGIDEFQLPVSDPATGAALIDRTVSMFSQTAPS